MTYAAKGKTIAGFMLLGVVLVGASGVFLGPIPDLYKYIGGGIGVMIGIALVVYWS